LASALCRIRSGDTSRDVENSRADESAPRGASMASPSGRRTLAAMGFELIREGRGAAPVAPASGSLPADEGSRPDEAAPGAGSLELNGKGDDPRLLPAPGLCISARIWARSGEMDRWRDCGSGAGTRAAPVEGCWWMGGRLKGAVSEPAEEPAALLPSWLVRDWRVDWPGPDKKSATSGPCVCRRSRPCPDIRLGSDPCDGPMPTSSSAIGSNEPGCSSAAPICCWRGALPLSSGLARRRTPLSAPLAPVRLRSTVSAPGPVRLPSVITLA